MRRTWRVTVFGAAAILALSATGCADAEDAGPPGSSASASSPVKGKGFDRAAVQADIDAATSAAGLPASGRPQPLPTPTPADVSEKDRLKARAAACMAHWTEGGRGLGEGGDPRAKFDATLTQLKERGWQAAGDPREEKVGQDVIVNVTLKRSGWTLMGRHTTGALEMLSFQAAEDACMNGFTEADWKLMLSTDE
ncbi:hypothetical protein AB0D99_22865 [Streptomyces sp. NPDC047971]|uniref:hypothetical protein n=1 Tax=Streptomyces sp. NPDC047971 TaxID=3154499 RepID=UPI0033DD9AE0